MRDATHATTLPAAADPARHPFATWWPKPLVVVDASAPGARVPPMPVGPRARYCLHGQGLLHEAYVFESEEHRGFYHVFAHVRTAPGVDEGMRATVNERPVAFALVPHVLRHDGVRADRLAWRHLPAKRWSRADMAHLGAVPADAAGRHLTEGQA